MRLSLTSLSKVLLGLLLPIFLIACTPEEVVPTLTGRVVDNANVLNAIQRQQLNSLLENIDRTTKVEIVVLTINDLPSSENLESYANKVFNKWGIGKKETDSGLLFLVVKNTKKIRIEVGRGNEGAMPDTIADQILREVMAPKFKEGKFWEGFTEAAHASVKYLKNEHK